MPRSVLKEIMKKSSNSSRTFYFYWKVVPQKSEPMGRYGSKCTAFRTDAVVVPGGLRNFVPVHHVDLSWNRVPQDGWFIRVHKETSHWNGWFGGTPIYGNPHMATYAEVQPTSSWRVEPLRPFNLPGGRHLVITGSKSWCFKKVALRK